MGGSVFIGIRKRSGEIYLAERWTNPTSWWFNRPEFYDPDEKVLDEYIALPQKNKDYKIQTEIHPSEYGVILYDSANRRLLSRQDYCGIGKALVSLNDVDMLELALTMRGVVVGVHAYPIGFDGVKAWENSAWGRKDPDVRGPIPVSSEKFPRFFEVVEGALKSLQAGEHWYAQGLPKAENAMFDVTWKIEGLEVNDLEGERGCHHWPDVLKWVSENGWTSPIWSQERVDQENRRLMEE